MQQYPADRCLAEVDQVKNERSPAISRLMTIHLGFNALMSNRYIDTCHKDSNRQTLKGKIAHKAYCIDHKQVDTDNDSALNLRAHTLRMYPWYTH